MGAKEIKSIETCTATDIIDYFKDIIGNDLEDLVYNSYDKKTSDEDRKYIDLLMEKRTIGNEEEKRKRRADIIYNIMKKSPNNTLYSFKVSLLSKIYTRYFKILSQSQNIKKMKKLKELILGDKEVAVLLNTTSEGIYTPELLTRDEPKSIESINDENRKKLIELSLDSILSITEMEYIAKYKELGSNIVKKCLIDFLRDSGDEGAQIIGKLIFTENWIIDDEEVHKFFENDDTRSDEFKKYILNYIKNNLHLIDVDSLLFSTAAKTILTIRVNKGENLGGLKPKEELSIDELQEGIRDAIHDLEALNSELTKKKANKNLKYTQFEENGEKIITIDLKSIQDFLYRCIEGNYYSDKDIEQIHKQIMQGVLPEDLRVRKIANINIDDLVTASKSYEEITDDEEAKAKLLSCSLELIKYLRKTGAISNDEQLLEMYLNGELNIDILDSAETPEMLEENHIEKFKTIYEKTKQEDEDGTHKKKLARYSELYKRMIIENSLNKDNLVMNLLEEYGEDSGNKILIDLYNLGMINLEDCINWAGTDVLKDLFEMENRNIQPNQINNLYHNNMLSLSEIANLILLIPNVEERYITIASIFPEISESEERQELIYKTIKVEKALNKKSKTDGNGIIHPVIPTDYNKHITDSTYRFNLIRLFDKDYFMEMTADGHAIIKLPKFKKVMIEKMLDTKKEEGYGAATYIVDEDYYTDNEDEIKVEGKINRKELIRALKMEKADRFSHIVEQSDDKENKKKKRVSWGEQLKRYFTGLSQSRYTEEEEKEIDNAIENISNSVRIIGVSK